jgi:hypothetical protein
MELAVSNQVTFEREGSTTFLTNEWPVTCVDTQMGKQMMLKREALFALAALIRPLSRMQ